MKLYATISANKLQNGQNITVKKGQGSNEWLDIKLTIEEHNAVHEIGIVRLQPHIDGYKLIIDRSSNFRHQAGRVYEEIINTKGEGNILCHDCGANFYGLEGKEDTCPSCLEKIIKGEKKKGEQHTCKVWVHGKCATCGAKA